MRSKGIHLSLVLVASAGMMSLVGCGSGDGDSARIAQTVDATRNTVASLKIVDNQGYVHYNSFYQFEVMGVDEKGNEIDLTQKASWIISEPSDANIGKIKEGYFSANSIKGDFKLIAEYAGLKTPAQGITVFDANLKSVAIDPLPNPVDECTNVTLTAKATFEGDITLPYPLTWKVTDGGTIARFKDAAKGTLNTSGDGQVKVVAIGLDNNKKEVKSPEMSVSIHDSLASIALVTSPAKTELRDGEALTVAVKGTYKDPANPIDITDNATITTDVENLLKIEGTQITAQNGTANGATVSLNGACGGVAGNLQLTIKERALKSIEIKNSNGGTSNLSMSEGSKLDLNVTATYINNATKDDYTSNVFWEIDDRNNSITDDSKVTISTSGEINVSSDLNLNNSVTIYVTAEVRDTDGDVLVNESGNQVKDEINITITPN